jgi:hypothetical protein
MINHINLKLKKMNKTRIFTLLLLTATLLSSCTEPEAIIEPKGDYENGFFVLNEGNFNSGNASLTFISDDYQTIEQEVFKGVNGLGLGDVAQSVFTHEDKAYIIVNNSNKIEVVNRYTMKKITTITGSEINNPRYMVAYNNKAYVSNWGVGEDPDDDSLVVIDLTTDTILSTIDVGFVPNHMVVVDDKLYVEIQGWWSVTIENKVDVIDLTNDTLIKTIEVGSFPNSILEYNNRVYVLSNENITEINTSSDTVTKTVNFPDAVYPSNLVNKDDNLYYVLNMNVYKWNTADPKLPTKPEIEVEKSIYGLTLNDGLLYVNHYADYTTGESLLNIYNIETKEIIEQSIQTGIWSNSVFFN